MKPAIGIRIAAESLALFSGLPGVLQIGLQAFAVVVGVDELIARVVWWVNVDHLHLANIRLLQELQRLQVVPFDDQVFRGIEVDAFLRRR